jgi:hypothetical protein
MTTTETDQLPDTPDMRLLERLHQSTERHRAEVEEIIKALAKLGEEAGVPPGDNVGLFLAAEYARKLDRLDDFDLEALEEDEGGDEDEDSDDPA